MFSVAFLLGALYISVHVQCLFSPDQTCLGFKNI